MEALGVNMKQTDEDRPAEAIMDGPFSGQTILFTGTLQTMGRKEARDARREKWREKPFGGQQSPQYPGSRGRCRIQAHQSAEAWDSAHSNRR
ncbi:MAG: hypothetical protein U0T81_05390 [Saprospiraceae bacterium]